MAVFVALPAHLIRRDLAALEGHEIHLASLPPVVNLAAVLAQVVQHDRLQALAAIGPPLGDDGIAPAEVDGIILAVPRCPLLFRVGEVRTLEKDVTEN